MNRHSWLAAFCVVAVAGLTTMPAGAAVPRPAAVVMPAVVAGNYTMHANFNGTGYQTFSMTLYSNHTGTDHYNDTIIWSVSDRNLTMTWDAGLWTYLGLKTKTGFNKPRIPGTLSNINGGTGIWYAVKIV